MIRGFGLVLLGKCHSARSPCTRVPPSGEGHAALGHPLPCVLQKTDGSSPRLVLSPFRLLTDNIRVRHLVLENVGD